jgi:hypothetical protein
MAFLRHIPTFIHSRCSTIPYFRYRPNPSMK